MSAKISKAASSAYSISRSFFRGSVFLRDSASEAIWRSRAEKNSTSGWAVILHPCNAASEMADWIVPQCNKSMPEKSGKLAHQNRLMGHIGTAYRKNSRQNLFFQIPGLENPTGHHFCECALCSRKRDHPPFGKRCCELTRKIVRVLHLCAA